MSANLEDGGPLEYVVYAFEACRDFPREAVRELLSLSEAEIVRVVDLLLLERSPEGTLQQVELRALHPTHPLSAFAESVTPLVTDDDVDALGPFVESDSCSLVFVLEHCWARELDMAVNDAGGTIPVSGPIDRGVAQRSLSARRASAVGLPRRRRDRPVVITTVPSGRLPRSNLARAADRAPTAPTDEEHGRRAEVTDIWTRRHER